MKQETLYAAVKDAERFVKIGRALLVKQPKGTWVESGKDAAAVKRASMDLTRALTNVRQDRS